MDRHKQIGPFFFYFGGKWRAARFYPVPMYKTIIEPFAGAAGYSTYYCSRKVLLYDLSPVIYGIWDYLIHVKETEFRALPVGITSIEGLDIPQEAKWLIGFWFTFGIETPPTKIKKGWYFKVLSYGWRGNYWSETTRGVIASSLKHIRHWKVFNTSYETAPDIKATWYIDPPYQIAGKSYKYKITDYKPLADWCLSRKGQVMVCENEGADWLPFKPFKTIHAGRGRGRKGKSKEVLWQNDYQRTGFNLKGYPYEGTAPKVPSPNPQRGSGTARRGTNPK